jgi:hypothetical protein
MVTRNKFNFSGNTAVRSHGKKFIGPGDLELRNCMRLWINPLGYASAAHI